MQMPVKAMSARASSLQAVTDSYARNDKLPGLSELKVSEDGSVPLTGARDVISLAGDGGDSSFAWDFYRL